MPKRLLQRRLSTGGADAPFVRALQSRMSPSSNNPRFEGPPPEEKEIKYDPPEGKRVLGPDPPDDAAQAEAWRQKRIARRGKPLNLLG